MDPAFTLFINPLKKGKTEEIDHQFSPEFLDVREEDLEFNHPVDVKGSAYVAGDDLILNLSIHTKATIPCSMCNDPVDVDVSLKDFYYVELLENIKSGVFEMQDTIREAILVETPSFVECHGGKCPQREQLEKYLTQPEEGEETGLESGDFHPFQDLTLDEESND